MLDNQWFVTKVQFFLYIMHTIVCVPFFAKYYESYICVVNCDSREKIVLKSS